MKIAGGPDLGRVMDQNTGPVTRRARTTAIRTPVGVAVRVPVAVHVAVAVAVPVPVGVGVAVPVGVRVPVVVRVVVVVGVPSQGGGDAIVGHEW